MIIITEEPDYQKITISYLKNFILDNNVSENDSISLDQKMFDELALNFRETYKEPIKVPFIFLGVWIKISDENRVRLRRPVVTKNDQPPSEETQADTGVSWDQVERCNNCGDLINSFGSKLEGYAHEIAVRRWRKFGDSVFIRSMCNDCKEKLYE